MTFYDVAATSSNYNPDGFLKFFNDDSFIKAYNGQTGVYSYISKDGIVIQRDSISSFFLKSGDYIGYYNYSDVSYPLSSSVTTLLKIFSEWCSKPLLNNAGMVDMMNRMKTVTFSNVMTVSTVHDKSPLSIEEVTSVQGEASVLANNKVTMSSTASNGSYIIRQTKQYAQHIYGGTSVAMVTGMLVGDSSASNVRSRIGVFDDSVNVTESNADPAGNGMFFQWDNSNGVTCVYRTNITGSQVDSIVQRNMWNQNAMIGAEGQTLYPNSNTTYVFEWNTHDADRPARLGVLAGGSVTYVHQFSGSNVPGFFGNPSLPVRWEVAHAVDIGAIPSPQEMSQGCASIMIDADGSMPSRVYGQDSGTLFKTLSSAGSIPMFSIRLLTPFGRSKLHPKKFTLVNSQAGAIAKWMLVLNPVLTGAVWRPVDSTSSWTEFSNAETGSIGGTVLSTGYIIGASVNEIDISDKLPALSSRLSGATDILTVVLSYVQGTVVASGGIEWRETE